MQKTFSFRLSDRELADLSRIAKERNRTKTDLLREFIRSLAKKSKR